MQHDTQMACLSAARKQYERGACDSVGSRCRRDLKEEGEGHDCWYPFVHRGFRTGRAARRHAGRPKIKVGKLPVNLLVGAYYRALRPTRVGAWQLRTQITLVF
jgi:hypothetical protein